MIQDWLGYRFRDWLDADGRPLGEIGSAHYPASTATAPCPYAGVRKGNPMNLPALKQVRAHWETNLATLTNVAGEVTALQPMNSAEMFTRAGPRRHWLSVQAGEKLLVGTTPLSGEMREGQLTVTVELVAPEFERDVTGTVALSREQS